MANNNLLLKKAIECVGGKEEFQRKYDCLRRSLSFFESHKEELLKKYDECWLALHNSDIIACEKNLPKLVDEINKSGFPEDEIFIQFISSKEAITLF